jgi:putative effector of murein hydrolase
MESQSNLTLIGLVAPIFIAIGAYCLAKKKNRNGWLWFINCLCTGLLGLLVLICSKPLDYDEDLDFIETDTLGYIMLIIAIVWFAITFYNGYYAAKSYHDTIIFDSMMQLMR